MIVKIYGRLQTPGHLCSDASKGKLTFTTKKKKKRMVGKNFFFFINLGGGWGVGGGIENRA